MSLSYADTRKHGMINNKTKVRAAPMAKGLPVAITI